MTPPPAAETGAFLERLRAAVAAVAERPPRRLVVAFSGGLDSTALLHGLHRIDASAMLLALHVDHGIHSDSRDWSAHCAAFAQSLGVTFEGRRVEVRRDRGESLEAAAREARYRVFREFLETGDVLLTAHHGVDQLETLLLRMLRGAGVRGMTAIHDRGDLGRGRFARPLLDFSRAEIEAYAVAAGLDWLDDPSNQDLDLDRNYLRATVVPALQARWPAAPRLASRLARRMGEAETLLTDLARADLGKVAEDPGRLPIGVLEPLGAARQANVLRFAVQALGLPPPSARQLDEIRTQLRSRSDAEPCVAWPGVEARMHRGHLYLMAPLPPLPAELSARIAVDAPWSGALGRIELVAAEGDGIPDRWAREGLTVRCRCGSERIAMPGSPHHKTLKHWFQEAGVVPWIRPRVPLLYHDDRLVAVADLGLAGDLPPAEPDEPRWQPRWSEHPRLR